MTQQNVDLIMRKLDAIIERSTNLNDKLDRIESAKKKKNPDNFISSTATASYSPRKTIPSAKRQELYSISTYETTKSPVPRKYIPQSTKFIEEDDQKAESNEILLEIYKSIKDLRVQVAEIAKSQVEMRAEIQSLKYKKK